MKENDLWNLIHRPKVRLDGTKPNIIVSKWAFKKKLESDGTIRYKVRLVSKGFKIKNKYDSKETYAPVYRMLLIRAVMSIVNKEDLKICQMDLKWKT